MRFSRVLRTKKYINIYCKTNISMYIYIYTYIQIYLSYIIYIYHIYIIIHLKAHICYCLREISWSACRSRSHRAVGTLGTLGRRGGTNLGDPCRRWFFLNQRVAQKTLQQFIVAGLCWDGLAAENYHLYH